MPVIYENVLTSMSSSCKSDNTKCTPEITKLNTNELLNAINQESDNFLSQVRNDLILYENPWYTSVLNDSSKSIINRTITPALDAYKSYTTVFEPNALSRYNAFSKNEISDMSLNHAVWNENFNGTTTLGGDSNNRNLIFSNLAVCLATQEDIPGIFGYFQGNVTVFIFDLQRGSIIEFRKIYDHVRLTKTFLSRAMDIPLQFSAICNISERLPLTGFFRKNCLNFIKLTYGHQIIITADRTFANKGSKNVVYVNCLGYINKLKNCDFIEIGDVRLRVMNIVKISILCEVVQSGIIIPQEAVTFPIDSLMDINDITPEEIDDINFAKDELINCIILPTYDCDKYFNTIKNLLNELNYSYCRIYATIYNKHIMIDEEQAKLIANTYDGLKLYIYRYNQLHEEIINLSSVTKYLIEEFYIRKKPILLGKLFSMDTTIDTTLLIESDYEKYIYYYPDKYILEIDENKPNYLQAYSNLQYYHKLLLQEYALEYIQQKSNDKLITDDKNIFVKTIVKGTYDLNVDCIIVSSKSGRLAINISHFRPNCPIIVLCNNINVLRFLNTHHNISVAFYNMKTKPNQQTLNLKKLWYGLVYAVSLKILKVEQNVLYVYEINGMKKIAFFRLTSNLFERLIQV